MQPDVHVSVLPGLVLTLVGVLAIPAVMLAGYGSYENFFGPNFLFGCSVLAVSGCHLLLFGFIAKLYAAPRRPGIPRLADRAAGGRVHRRPRAARRAGPVGRGGRGGPAGGGVTGSAR